MRRRAILLMGPTGSGKSDLAMRLAETLPLEIVSVDSALVYRGMDIGTAKPTAAVRERVAHHLIDIRDPAQSYSAGEFTRDAVCAMQDIWRRGRGNKTRRSSPSARRWNWAAGTKKCCGISDAWRAARNQRRRWRRCRR